MTSVQQAELLDTLAACDRCSRPCKPSGPGNPDARPFRRADRGLCLNCVVTQLLQTLDPLASLLVERGPEPLLDTRIQQQFGTVMLAGLSDGSASEIDWRWIVDNWHLPIPGQRKRRRGAA